MPRVRLMSPALLVAICGSAGFASCETFPPVLQLGSLAPGDGFKMAGLARDDRCGEVVSSAGDINGDGFDDIVITAPDAGTGAAYVVFGGPTVGASGSFDLAALDGTNGFEVVGAVREIDAAAPAGDLNADGVDDLVLGVPRDGAGRAYVVFGKPSIGSSGTVDLSTLPSADGITVSGVSGTERVGASLSPAGDLNRDGFDDVLIGAPRAGVAYQQPVPGEGWVIFGGPGVAAQGDIDRDDIAGPNGVRIQGTQINSGAGSSVALAGDINGDGWDDLTLGAPSAGYVYDRPGLAFAMFNVPNIGSSRFVPLGNLTGPNGLFASGLSDRDELGRDVASAGDLNDDGFDDLILGAPLEDPDNKNEAGVAYVVFGGPAIGGAGEYDLSTLDGSNGFEWRGNFLGDRSGSSVARVGDLNGDGVEDVAIGAPYAAGASGGFESGKVYILYGAADVGSQGFLREINLFDGTKGIVIEGELGGGRLGWSAAPAGDVNGDGAPDLILGAPNLGTYATRDMGAAYVVFGRCPPGPEPCEGDVDGDGDTDVFDFADLAAAFGSMAGDASWNPGADLSDEGGLLMINVFDFAELASDFGCEAP